MRLRKGALAIDVKTKDALLLLRLILVFKDDSDADRRPSHPSGDQGVLCGKNAIAWTWAAKDDEAGLGDTVQTSSHWPGPLVGRTSNSNAL